VLLLPVLTGLMLWRHRGRAWVTPFLALNLFVWLALAPVMSGLVQGVSMMAHIDMPGFQAFLNGYQGLLQRVAAATVFGPVAFAAWLLRRSKVWIALPIQSDLATDRYWPAVRSDNWQRLKAIDPPRASVASVCTCEQLTGTSVRYVCSEEHE